ncbi:hypothetical protein ACT414_18660 (plasmid) [Acinetobacter baumannii]
MVKIGAKIKLVKIGLVESVCNAKLGDVGKVVGRYNGQGNGIVAKNPNWKDGTLCLGPNKYEVI